MLKVSFGASTTLGTLRARAVAALLLVAAVNPSRPLAAQVITFDPSNYGKNLLTAARSLQQINNQVRSLENQAQSLLNQAKNLTSLPTSVVGQLASTDRKSVV